MYFKFYSPVMAFSLLASPWLLASTPSEMAEFTLQELLNLSIDDTASSW
jgi:hypothetical protein